MKSSTSLTIEHYRLVVLGSGGVGKSSLVDQFLNGIFPKQYCPTIEDIHRHLMVFPDGLFRGMEILDTAGLHQFPAMRELSIKTGKAFVIVFAVNDQQSFTYALSMIELIKQIKGSEPVPIIVVGNKNDLKSEREVDEENARTLTDTFDAMYLETSAKDTENAREVFNSLLHSAFGSSAGHQSNMTSRKQRISEKLSRRLSAPMLRRISDSDNNNQKLGDPKCTIL